VVVVDGPEEGVLVDFFFGFGLFSVEAFFLDVFLSDNDFFGV